MKRMSWGQCIEDGFQILKVLMVFLNIIMIDIPPNNLPRVLPDLFNLLNQVGCNTFLVRALALFTLQVQCTNKYDFDTHDAV